MRLTFTLFLLLVIVSAASPTALSHRDPTKIKGTLFDSNNSVVPGVLVTFKGKTETIRAYTNENGVFEIELPEGEYDVEIEATGFKRLEIKKLEVLTGIVKELSVHLDPKPIPLCVPILGVEAEHIEIVTSPLSERIRPRKIQ